MAPQIRGPMPTRREQMTFDPPDRVAPVAFSELLSRLGRARALKPTDATLAQEEKVIFTHGVAKRRRVLEHTVLLIFGQWLTYRQLISKLTASRPLRSAYVAASCVSTSVFLRTRATQVSNDLFAHIATQDASNSLANEARIVLAELEGPSGPYFKKICDEKGFQQLLSSDSDAIFPTADDDRDVAGQGNANHPQFNLSPRLLSNELLAQSVAAHPHISPKRANSPAGRGGSTSKTDDIEQKPSPIRMRARPKSSSDENDKSTDLSTSSSSASATQLNDFDNDDKTNTNRVRNSTRQSSKFSSRVSQHESPPDEERWGSTSVSNDTQWGSTDFPVNKPNKPFDFSNPKTTGDSNLYGNVENTESNNQGGDRDDATLTPSQRRAAERKRERLAAKTRVASSSSNRSNTGSGSNFEF